MNINRRLVNLVQESRTSLIITIVAGVLGGLLTIAQARGLSATISHVFIDRQMLQDVSHQLQVLLIIIAGRGFLTWVGEVSAKAVAIQVKNGLRQKLYAHIQFLGPQYVKGVRTGEITAAAVEGIETLDAYFSQYLPQLFLSAIIPISILIYVFPLDPLSGVILLVTAPLIPIFMILIGKAAENLTNRQYETLSRLSAHFLDSLQGLTTLKLFGQSKTHAESIDETSQQFRDTTMRVLRVTFLSALVLELLATLSTAVIAVEVGLRLLYARMSFGQAFTLLILAPEFYIPLRMLGLRFHAGMNGASAARKIFSILDIQTGENIGDESSYLVDGPGINVPVIRFLNVSFAYLEEEKPALKEISLTIEPGQNIALVGQSGAGKTTLTALLLRFIKPDEGSIQVDGQDLDDIPPDKWRELIAWVPQDPFIFNTSVANNIRLGKPGAEMNAVVEAAKVAHMHEFVESLPCGYDTVVGEGGARLSGGQVQRLALARAFISDAPILILDEPTSHLDPIIETLLEESTSNLMSRNLKSRTIITIAHRMSTMIQSDQIVVLEDGRIVEHGTHDGLMAEEGGYSSMVHRQNQKIIGESKLPPLDTMADAGPGNINLMEAHPEVSKEQPLPPGKIFIRLLAFLNGSWGQVALSVLVGSATIFSSIGLIGTSAWLISTAALHPSIAALQMAIVGVRFLGISRGVFRYLERLISHDVTFRTLARIRTWFYQAVEPLAPACLMGYRSGDLLSRIVADVDTLENFYIRVVNPAITALLVSVAAAIYVGFHDVRMGLVLFIFLLGVGILVPLFTRWISAKPGRRLVTNRGNLHAQLVDGIQGAADLLVFNRAADHQEQLNTTGELVGRMQVRLAHINGCHAGLSLVMSNLGMWSILVLGIEAVRTGQITGVMLGTLTMIALVSFEAVQPLPLAAQKYGETTQAARRLFELVDAEPEIFEESGEILNQELQVKIEFSNLSFTYPKTAVPALKSVSLFLEEGRTYAIVGPSGAGKTTLMNLLLRFWDYHQGEILFDGRSLKKLLPDDLRGQIAVVSQRPYFFNSSLGGNLKIARPTASNDEIESAARMAHIHDFIAGLPQGYDTFIGEQGARLSGGERQRLGIARALLKDTPILIFDEPTANLDPINEMLVMESIYGLKGTKNSQGINRTTILITHRFLSLDQVDEIFVMDQGRIVERGTQVDLLGYESFFAYMYGLQNKTFEVS